MQSQGPGQLKDVVEDQCRVTKSVDPARVVPAQALTKTYILREALIKNL